MISQELLLTTLGLQKTGSIKSQAWVGERDTLVANGFWETGSNCFLGFYPLVGPLGSKNSWSHIHLWLNTVSHKTKKKKRMGKSLERRRVLSGVERT